MNRVMSFALIVLLVLLVSPVYAQVETNTYCGDLSKADCELLSESAVAMQALESNTFSMEATFSVSNVPDTPFEELNFDLSGQGSLAANVTELPEIQLEDFLGNGMTAFPLVADLLRASTADMTFTLHLPEELRQPTGEQDQALPDHILLDLRMVDGILYVNLADIAAAVPEANVPAGWIGMDVAEFYETVLPKMLADMPSSATFDIVPVMTALMQPENLSEFATIERVADSEIDNQTMAVFETRLNYVAMLEIPEFQEALRATVGEDDADKALEVIRALYEGINLVMTENIGVQDKLVHSTEIQMEWDLSALAEMTDQNSAPHFSIDVVLTKESFNDAPVVVAPDDATLLPLQQLFPTTRRNS